MTLTRKKILFLFYFTIIILVLQFYKDLGIHIEEKFHRMNGLYWLNYISKIFNFKNIFLITESKMNLVNDYTLFWDYNALVTDKYGIIFDVPLALFEIIFKIEKIENVYHTKHFLSFLIFLLSSTFFYKILIKRFKNFFLCLIGTSLFISSPRIFGDSFLYKDVLFLSFFTISLHFLLNVSQDFKIKNLIYFAVFSSITFTIRPFGIFLPLVYFIILLIKYFYTKNIIKYVKFYFFYILIYFFSLIIFFPYLWSNPFANFIEIFSTLKETGIITIRSLYNNNYVTNQNVPPFYLITWMIISTPILVSIFSITGFISYLKRFLIRFIKIREVSIFNDLWRGNNEQTDFIIFLLVIFHYFAFSVLDAPLHNGWRLAYFLNFFIIYFTIYFINNLFFFLRKKKLKKNLLSFVSVFLVLYNLVIIVKYHPYQSYYFNELLDNKKKNGFEIDYYGLGAKNFFLKISEENKDKILSVAVASWTPIHRGLEGINLDLRKNIKVVGQEYEFANYIYKNNISEVDHRLNKKYKIPENFNKIYELNIEGLKIYEIYKNKNIK